MDVDFTEEVELAPGVFVVWTTLFQLFDGIFRKIMVLLHQYDVGVGPLPQLLDKRVVVPGRSTIIVDSTYADGCLDHLL